MKTSPFIGTSQLQQLSLSKSLDEPAMKKRVVAAASRHLATSVPLVQPSTSVSAKQFGSSMLLQPNMTDVAGAEVSKLTSSVSRRLLDQ
jgi:hypothetical protein